SPAREDKTIQIRFPAPTRLPLPCKAGIQRTAADFATDTVRVNFWDTQYWGGFDSAKDWAAKGFEVILSNPDYLYLDMPYEVNPAERGYYWATRYSDEAKVFSFAPNNWPQNAETSVDRDGNFFTAKSDKPWPGATGIS
ncbi:family 20 glycosylhydrolase, partial [Pseudovibrio exalbescens]|uniref:family 20 glycosylhydrolase n=1 Tax=Pseudovibrio exalbescens TaxID=197461 RepID=UPI0015E14253